MFKKSVSLVNVSDELNSDKKNDLKTNNFNINAFIEGRKNRARNEADRMIIEHLIQCKTGELAGPLSLKSCYILHLFEDGLENFKTNMLTHWQNMAVVCALLGAIATTVLLSGLSRSVGYNSSNGYMEDEEALLVARIYYILWGISTVTNVAGIMLSVCLSVHFTDLMMLEADKVWFILVWGDIFNLTDVFCTVGALTFLAACCLGVFLLTDSTTGYIVSSFIGFGVLLFLSLWIAMLTRNLTRQRIHFDEAVIELKKAKLQE